MSVLGWMTKLQVGNAATHALSSTYTDLVAELTDLTPPGLESDSITTSHFQSPNMVKEFVAGWGEASEVEFTGHYSKTEYTALVALYRVSKGFRVIFNDGDGSTTNSGIRFDGYVASLGEPVSMDGLVEVKGKIKVSGLPTFDETIFVGS